MEHDTNNSLREKVLTRIHEQKTKMIPRWHFVLKAGLCLLGCILILLLVIYLLSFTFFILDENRLWFVPEFGMRGILLFLSSLPWLVIAAVLLFVVLLQVLVTKYAFAYHRPLLFSVMGIVGVVTLGSLVVRQVRFHEEMEVYSRRNNLPFAPLYQKMTPYQNDHIYPGFIIEFHAPEKDFSLETRTQEVFEVHITPMTRLPAGKSFSLGDEVIVLGDRQGNRIEAFGIKKIRPFIVHMIPEHEVEEED